MEAEAGVMRPEAQAWGQFLEAAGDGSALSRSTQPSPPLEVRPACLILDL